MPVSSCLDCGAPSIPAVRERCPFCGGALTPVALLEKSFVEQLSWLRIQYERSISRDVNEMDRFLLALGMAWAELDA